MRPSVDLAADLGWLAFSPNCTRWIAVTAANAKPLRFDLDEGFTAGRLRAFRAAETCDAQFSLKLIPFSKGRL
jgi:hypothetical protein